MWNRIHYRDFNQAYPVVITNRRYYEYYPFNHKSSNYDPITCDLVGAYCCKFTNYLKNLHHYLLILRKLGLPWELVEKIVFFCHPYNWMKLSPSQNNLLRFERPHFSYRIKYTFDNKWFEKTNSFIVEKIHNMIWKIRDLLIDDRKLLQIKVVEKQNKIEKKRRFQVNKEMRDARKGDRWNYQRSMKSQNNRLKYFLTPNKVRKYKYFGK